MTSNNTFDNSQLINNKKDFLAQNVILQTLAQFINCLPDLICIIHVHKGEILVYNNDFKNSVLDEVDPIYIFECFDEKSQSVLRSNLANVLSYTPIQTTFNLTCQSRATTSSWSIRRLTEMGIADMVVLHGRQKESFSIVQSLRSSISSAITNKRSRAVHPRTVDSADNVPVVSQIANVSRLIEFGEKQLRHRMVDHVKRSNTNSLRQAYEETQNLSNLIEQKKAMVRSIAHEIRTPLTVVLSGLQLLEMECDGTHPTLSPVIEDMKISCEAAIDTIGDFIAYEKLDSNIMTADKTTTNFYSVVTKCLRPFRIQAKNSQIDLRFVSDNMDSPCFIHADVYKLNQVLRNLISNAIKFSAAKSLVSVRVFLVPDRQPRMIRVEVADNGPGISEENQAKLFNEIVQFHPSAHQGGGGSGLGLWISKRIVDMHNGSIGVMSAGEGYGCTFYIELPVIERQEEVESAAGYSESKAEVEVLSRAQSSVRQSRAQSEGLSSCASGLVPAGPADLDPDELSKLHFLLVDDAAMVRKMTKKLLDQYGVTTSEASNGLEAIAKVKMFEKAGNSLDAIIMDNSMRVMDGPAAAVDIRRLGYKGKLFGLTGNACDEENQIYISNGADRVLIKPMTKDMLQQVFFEVLEFKKQSRLQAQGRAASFAISK